MRFSSLVKLAQPEFELHFPASCRDAHLARLSAATNLLHPEPIAHLTVEAGVFQVDIPFGRIKGVIALRPDFDLLRRSTELSHSDLFASGKRRDCPAERWPHSRRLWCPGTCGG
nr:hypothetical protein [Primorskyibacter marinus]